MKNLSYYISEYHKQLQKGDILIAYDALVKFVMRIRTQCIKNHSNLYSYTGILHGYMDYTYFYFTDDYLKSKKLKLGFVLNHVEMRFEIWLLGNTKAVQDAYWEMLRDSEWNAERNEKPQYSILEAVISDEPDFDQLDVLEEILVKKMLETSTLIVSDLKRREG